MHTKIHKNIRSKVDGGIHGYTDRDCDRIKKKPMVRVRERTIPTERPPLVGEVIANLCG
jgi:hypothetical protein